MPVVWIKLPEIDDVEVPSNGRPRHCPYCGSQILQRWGKITKAVQDVEDSKRQLFRYKCMKCDHTFRVYPEGTDRSMHSQRIREVAGLAWALGMSCREVVEVFEGLGVNISHTTVWREGHNLIAQMQAMENSEGVKRFSIDRIYIHKISTKLGVVVALSMGSAKRLILGTIDELNPSIVKSWIESLISDIQVDVAVLETASLDPNTFESDVLATAPA